MTPRESIVKFLSREADSFWTDAAMGYIGRVLAGNSGFVTEVRAQSVIMDKGVVRRYNAKVIVSDADGNLYVGLIVYAFNPRRTKAHTVSLTITGAK